MTERVLCVDDDPNVLAAYQRGLRKQFVIDTATSGDAALEAIAARGPYAVVVSDMRMPGMDGVQLLASVKERAPATVRIMLTGNADQGTAVQAVNEGSIFRFLTKPCEPEALARAIAAGIEQYRLVTAEKELLEKTVRGSVKVLTEVLSLASPMAFGRASRVRELVRKIGAELGFDKPWLLDLAAMLSQIGCVSLPPGILEKAYRGEKLAAEEAALLASHPRIGSELIANIPRLEGVAEIIAYQEKRHDGTGPPQDGRRGAEIPLGARILKAALDYDAAKSAGAVAAEAIDRLGQRSGWYDPTVLAALGRVAAAEEACETREVLVRDLTNQMVLAEDVETVTGILLVSRGNEVTPYLRERLKNYAQHTRIREPLRVYLRPGPAPPPRASAQPATIGRR